MKKSIFLLIVGVFLMFQSYAHVSLNNPIGGETFTPGTTVNIQWQILITHSTQNWDLFFSSDGGATWDTILMDISAGTLNYQWTVPSTLTAQAQIKIVMDNSGTDYNDISPNFTIANPVGINNISNVNKIVAYPNPLTDYTILKFENPLKEPQTLTLYNSTGQIVRVINNIKENTLIFRRENLSSGLYFFQIGVYGKTLASGKLVIKNTD